MPVLRDWDLRIDVNQVMRSQGADPFILRARSPELLAIAQRAIAEGSGLLEPQLLFRRMRVASVSHGRVKLEAGGEQCRRLPTQHFASAQEIIVILCTIGGGLEARVAEAMRIDPVYAMALDGLGSAGVQALATAGCQRFELEARERGLEMSAPLSPGGPDWPVEQGQREVFRLLPADEIGVRLMPSWVMRPRKSLTMVVGVGTRMRDGGACDYCSMHGTCRYQDLSPKTITFGMSMSPSDSGRQGLITSLMPAQV